MPESNRDTPQGVKLSVIARLTVPEYMGNEASKWLYAKYISAWKDRREFRDAFWLGVFDAYDKAFGEKGPSGVHLLQSANDLIRIFEANKKEIPYHLFKPLESSSLHHEAVVCMDTFMATLLLHLANEEIARKFWARAVDEFSVQDNSCKSQILCGAEGLIRLKIYTPDILESIKKKWRGASELIVGLSRGLATRGL